MTSPKPKKPTTKRIPKPIGRPTDYTKELALELCERIETGNSLRKVCKAGDMPNRSTVNDWLGLHTEFTSQYARACEVRRSNRFDYMYTVAKTEKDVQRARLMVDVIKWQLSKEEPKKYGDKIDMTSNGKDIVIPILGGLSSSNTNDDIKGSNE